MTFSFVWPARSVIITFNSDASGNVFLVHDEQCTDVNGANMSSLTATGTPAGESDDLHAPAAAGIVLPVSGSPNTAK